MTPTGNDTLNLRAEAEAQLATAVPLTGDEQSQPMSVLLHDLQVYEIELKLQNDELRSAQVALEESRDRYMDLFEFAPVGYLTLNAQGFIEEINLTAVSMLRQDRTTLRHRRFASLVPLERRDELHRKFLRALHHGDMQSCEIDLVRDDASRLNVVMECRPSIARTAPPVLRIVLTDITRLQNTMDELLAWKNRLQLAKNATRLGIFDHDFEKGTHYFDERLCELWGLDPTEAVSYEQFVAGIHPDDRAETLAAVQRALDPAGDGLYSADYRVLGHGGQLRHITTNGQVFFDKGCVKRFVGTARDISVRKQEAQDAQALSSQMESLARKQAAAQTAAAIAHEINQPLAATCAYSEAALHMLRAGNPKPEKLLHALERSVEQAQRASRSVVELLAFLHSNVVDPEVADPGKLVREAIMVAMQSGYGDFRYSIEVEPQLRPVLVNRLQVQKVLVNLISNSLDAMRAAGAMDAPILVTVQQAQTGNFAQVVVKDRGVGLDHETASRVFEAFYTTKNEGIGLGLAISRTLIEANGGQLWVDPQEAPGATFNFTMPFAP